LAFAPRLIPNTQIKERCMLIVDPARFHAGRRSLLSDRQLTIFFKFKLSLASGFTGLY
jgi:hypothetical protein